MSNEFDIVGWSKAELVRLHDELIALETDPDRNADLISGYREMIAGIERLIKLNSTRPQD